MTDLTEERRRKLAVLREKGIDPFSSRFERTLTAREGKELFEAGKLDDESHFFAGRIMSLRSHGKSTFAHIQDMTGRLQVYFKLDTVGTESYETVKLLDIGDLVGVTGALFRTRTGEITVMVERVEVLAKSLRALPIVKEEQMEDGTSVLYDIFADKEQRYRQRYVDLIVNREVREKFLLRSRAISLIRDFLDGRGFVEVETPILQPLYGGAAAKPFLTHHNVLDMKLYLRIADELYLKRLVVGGFEKVYEFCKDFRNEGLDRLHNPEFTMIELYEAYADYRNMMNLIEEMVSTVMLELYQRNSLTYQGVELDFSAPWERITFLDALDRHAGITLENWDEAGLRRLCSEREIEVEEDAGPARLFDKLFSELVEPNLVQPTIVFDYPAETTPLAKRKPDKPELVERFELFVSGIEIANAFSELTDPLEQRKRFEAQLETAGVELGEDRRIDEDYLRALDYGMPPTGGMGIGVDRLIMLLTDSPSIKEVILFPQLKPES